MVTNLPARRFDLRDRLFLGALLAVSLTIGLAAIYHYGYIAQDFDGPGGHPYHIYTFPDTYTFALTNPPGLFWFGHLFYAHVSATHYLAWTALCFLILNTAALGILYGLLWRSIDRWQLRYAAAALLTFIPFRDLHAIIIAADGFTLPFFALSALLVVRLCEDIRRGCTWAALSLALSAALACKYTFVGTLPAIAVVLAVHLFRQLSGPSRWRWGLAGLAALALPAAVFLGEMRASTRANGATTAGYWLPRDAEPLMRWRDILTLQRSDRQIFSAPQYFRDELYAFRKYSYPALLHLTTFTDSQNIRQPPPAGISFDWNHRWHDSILRDRTSRAQTLEVWAVRAGVPFSILALLGTLACAALSVPVLLCRKPWLSDAAVVLTALAVGYYAPVFVGLHRINDPYTAGYWLPRLVLPGLLVFFGLGFVLLDLAGRPPARARLFGIVSSAVLAYTLAVCLIFIGFLA